MRLRPTSAALLFGLAGIGLFAVAPAFTPDTAPQAGIVAGFALEFFLGTLAIALASFSGRGVVRRLGLGASRIPWGTTGILVIGTLSLSFALNGIYDLGGFGDDGALAQFESELDGIRGWTLAAAIGSFALAPGVAEELLCRGFIQRGLLGRFGPVVSVGLAALVFGALHIEPVYAVLAALLGAYLGWITLIGGSIRPSIVCHASNNLVAVGTAAWGLEIDLAGTQQVVLLIVTGLFAAAALVWTSRRIGGLPSPDRRGENSPVPLQPHPGSDDS